MNIIPFPIRETIEKEVEGGLYAEVMAAVDATAAWLCQADARFGALSPEHVQEASRGKMLLTCMYLDMAGVLLVVRSFAGGDISAEACAGRCGNIGPLREREFLCHDDAPELLREIGNRIGDGNRLLRRVANLRRRALIAAGA